MSYRAQGLLPSSRSFTGPDTPLLRLGQMFDMLSPVGLPKIKLLSWKHTCTHIHAHKKRGTKKPKHTQKCT